MQQVGGALGLSLLATIATSTFNDGDGRCHPAPTRRPRLMVFSQAFAQGATHAFVFASLLMLVASAVTWTVLNVKHDRPGHRGGGRRRV